MSAALPAWTGNTLRGVLRPAGGTPPPGGDGEPLVLRVDPADGASGVFRDTPVIVSLSQPADAATVSRDSFRVEAAGRAEVEGGVRLSPDGSVLIWTASRPLAPGVVHFVAIRGVCDRRGVPVKAHVSRFVPCDIALSDLMPPRA
ncbi:MAG TPA: Ig-like domain-containing protein [Vicinamibacteria bacterium]|nr:Ig-like domain-containing protein [Vicinamibacteria bacterium]